MIVPKKYQRRKLPVAERAFDFYDMRQKTTLKDMKETSRQIYLLKMKIGFDGFEETVRSSNY